MRHENISGRLIYLLCCFIAALSAVAEEPALPTGLGDATSEIALPPGLDEGEDSSVEIVDSKDVDAEGLLPDFSGFFESRGGIRIEEDPHQKRASIGETRLQLKTEKSGSDYSLQLTTDFIGDFVADDYVLDLEHGTGFMDLREAFLLLRPFSFADIKVGRQILTWGSGDFIFINDLFPKDWNSFFSGRDDEYLKAPSDSLKLAFFSELANLDFVYTPRFDSDRFIDGRRVSYYSPLIGAIVGQNMPINAESKNQWFRDDEFFLRLYKNIAGYEAALYGYAGYWKSPSGNDINSGEALYPAKYAYGASVRGPLADGIFSSEIGYYDSREDPRGDNPFIKNSELRFLVAYEQELFTNFTAGFQYYLEYMQDYDNYLSTLPEAIPARDEDRHLLTLRLTKLAFQQNLLLSLFVFYSPSDEDSFTKIKANYKISDNWQVEGGSNLFFGKKDYSFFGQFEDMTNAYLALRYSFI